MKEKIIGVEATNQDNDNLIQEYVIKKIVNGEIESIIMSNDTEKFQELLREYHSFLKNKKANLLKDLNPRKMLSNFKTNALATYLLVVSLAFLYCLFMLDSNFILRVVGFSSLGVGGALMSYFSYLEKKYDNPKARQELRKLEEEIKKYEKTFEKSKMAMIARESIDRRKSVSLDSEIPKKTKEESKTSETPNNGKFQPDRPSFMKNLNVTNNTGILYDSGFSLSSLSRKPLRYTGVNTGQFAHAHSASNVRQNPSSSRSAQSSRPYTGRFTANSNGSRIVRDFNPDRPSFMDEDEYRSGGFTDFDGESKKR